MLLHSGMMGEPYGLINTSQWPNTQVPLETFNVYAHVVNNIADVTCELSYMNDTSEFMESTFVFRLKALPRFMSLSRLLERRGWLQPAGNVKRRVMLLLVILFIFLTFLLD